jgi:hypothetical protein
MAQALYWISEERLTASEVKFDLWLMEGMFDFWDYSLHKWMAKECFHLFIL